MWRLVSLPIFWCHLNHSKIEGLCQDRLHYLVPRGMMVVERIGELESEVYDGCER